MLAAMTHQARPIRACAAAACALFAMGAAPARTQTACAPFWTTLGSQGPNGPVHASAKLPNGDVVLGGQFTDVAGVPANNIARWDGSTWHALGNGLNGYVMSLAVSPNGDLLVGGPFTAAGAVTALRVARWSGVSWSAIGNGFSSGWVRSLAAAPNGDLFAGVDAAVHRWNGSAWQQIGYMNSGWAAALVVRAGGELLVAGSAYLSLFHYGAALGRWNGATWTVTIVNNTDSYFDAALPLPNGDIVLAGQFAFAGSATARNVVRWDGTSFWPLGSGVGGATDYVSALASLPDGSLVAGGSFVAAGGAPAANIARWDGLAWSQLAGGTNGPVNALAVSPDGGIAAGVFTQAGGASAANLAQWQTPCAASVAAYGSGCTGPGGPAVLTAANGPWVGATFRATGTGIPGVALVAAVYGFATQSVSLPAVLPGAFPGCDLLLTPDIVDVLLPTAGTVESRVSIPNVPTAPGFAFYHQLVALEITGILSFGAITSTNGLALVVGSY